jgi:hypothetical protein
MPKNVSNQLGTNMVNLAKKEIAIKQRIAEASAALRDIGPLPVSKINWDRRNACRYDLKLFNETYLKNVFSRPWSDSHLHAISRLQKTSLETSMFALAMPRGEGKTSVAIGSCIWDQAYGHRRYLYFIGSDQEQSEQRLQAIKDEWFYNIPLQEDFPELAFPILKIDGRNELTKGQRFSGRPTRIDWATDEIHFAALVFPFSAVELWLDHGCEDDVIPLDDEGEYWSFKSNGNIMKVKGIGGNIRGVIYRHPLIADILRPDKFILDDVQTDKVAENPSSVRKMIRHINGAIKGLADGKRGISGVNLCTVRADGDVSEHYLDSTKSPEWQPLRCSMVRSWPEGITDVAITDATETSRHWQVYAEIRNAALKEDGNFERATAYYQEHQDIMDDGFVVDNPHRFEEPAELSGQQAAMNLRLYDLITFMSEYMNKPMRELASGTIVVNIDTVLGCAVELPRFAVPMHATELCAHIDVGEELLWYGIGTSSRAFNVHIPDYGTWPPNAGYITKAKAAAGKFITREFDKVHKGRIDGVNSEKAGIEARIYWALQQLIGKIKNTVLYHESGVEMRVSKIGIDAAYGKLTKTIYRLIYDLRDPMIFPTFGRFVGATSQPFSEYTQHAGWVIGEHLIIKPPTEKDLDMPNMTFPLNHLLVDANYWKSFIWNRFATPVGSSIGTITLFKGDHEMYADHITKAEFPTPVTARSITLDEWQSIPGQDNDLFDVTYNIAAILSLMGCSISSNIKATMSSPIIIGANTTTQTSSQPFNVTQTKSDSSPSRKIGKRTFVVRNWRK